jgi:hypothetical protein
VVAAIGGTGTASSATFGKNTDIWIWLDWDVNTTDTATVYWNDSDSKPTGDSTKQSTRSAAASTQAGRIYLYSDLAGADILFDNVQVWETL